MRKLALIIAAGSAALVAIPASAQPAWRMQAPVQRQIQQDINQLDNQIERAMQRRAVSAREGKALRRQAHQVQRSFNRFARNGLDRAEVRQLEMQVNAVRQNLRLERRDWDGRRG